MCEGLLQHHLGGLGLGHRGRWKARICLGYGLSEGWVQSRGQPDLGFQASVVPFLGHRYLTQ